MRIVSGFKNTKTNQEDFAITPYLFGVKSFNDNIKVLGIGLCWGYYSIYIGLGKNIPKGFPYFHIIK